MYSLLVLVEVRCPCRTVWSPDQVSIGGKMLSKQRSKGLEKDWVIVHGMQKTKEKIQVHVSESKCTTWRYQGMGKYWVKVKC